MAKNYHCEKCKDGKKKKWAFLKESHLNQHLEDKHKIKLEEDLKL